MYLEISALKVPLQTIRHESRREIVIKNRGVAEWSIAAVLKTVVPRGTGGSNPSSSAFEPCN